MPCANPIIFIQLHIPSISSQFIESQLNPAKSHNTYLFHSFVLHCIHLKHYTACIRFRLNPIRRIWSIHSYSTLTRSSHFTQFQFIQSQLNPSRQFYSIHFYSFLFYPPPLPNLFEFIQSQLNPVVTQFYFIHYTSVFLTHRI